MELGSLPETLEGFFDSLLPALTQSLLFVAFIVFFFGTSTLTSWIKPHLSRLKAPDTLATDPFVKESGLLKLVPIGLLVVVLLLAIVLDRTVSYIGYRIPGQLGYSQPDVLVHAVPDEYLARLWSLFPAADDEHMLYLVLEQQVFALSTPANVVTRFPWQGHDEIFSRAVSRINSIKFYVVLGLIICLARKRFAIQDRSVWRRYLVVVVAAVVLAGFLVTQQIEAKKQSDWAKVNYVLAKHVAAGGQAESRLQDKAVQKKFAERLADYRDRHRRHRIAAFYLRL